MSGEGRTVEIINLTGSPLIIQHAPGAKTMVKKVDEIEYKFFMSHLDSVLNEHYVIQKVDVEDNSPQQHINCNLDVASLPDRYKKFSGDASYRLKSMKRHMDSVPFIEHFYLRTS